MRQIITPLLLLLNLHYFSQTKNISKTQTNKTTDTVSFIAKFDITKATKDGYFLNGYIIDINSVDSQKFNGKKIKVRGKVTVIKGLKNRPKEYDRNGNELIVQGRIDDTKHIESPTITVLDK